MAGPAGSVASGADGSALERELDAVLRAEVDRLLASVPVEGADRPAGHAEADSSGPDELVPLVLPAAAMPAPVQAALRGAGGRGGAGWAWSEWRGRRVRRRRRR